MFYKNVIHVKNEVLENTCLCVCVRKNNNSNNSKHSYNTYFEQNIFL